MESQNGKVPGNTPALDLSDKIGLLELVADLRHSADRKRTGLFFTEGAKMVVEAVHSRAPIEAIIVAPELCPPADAVELCMKRVPSLVVEVGRRRYEKSTRHFVLKTDPQGIGVLARQVWESAERFTPARDSVIPALNSVQDAGNVGTILRTSDAVGGDTAFILGETADPYGPLAVRASLGSVFSHTFVRTDCDGLRRMAERTGLTIVGTSPRAPHSYKTARYKRPMVLMLGNEAKGLSDEEMALCHEMVSIPMVGRRDSLNVAVAGGIILYEIASQA